MNNKNFYILGKYFETFEEMMIYQSRFACLPVDLQYLEEFLQKRFSEIKVNVEMNPGFTNKQAHQLLRMSTDWAKE